MLQRKICTLLMVMTFLGSEVALAAEEKDTPNSSEKSKVVSSTEATSVKPPIEILEFVLSNKVEGREPKDIVENFNLNNSTGLAYAFARLSTKEHAQLTFVWFKEGKEYNRFTTHIQAAKKWRTYSSTKLRPGNWKVQLVSKGQVLVECAFTVQ